MIYAYLLGGVGNLCFIIANAYSLALDNNDQVVFSKTIESITHRKNEDLWFQTIFKDIKKGTTTNRKIYRQKKYTYSKVPYQRNMKIMGYFQSEQYFDHHRKEILQLFTGYKKNMINSLTSYIGDSKTISLHIRRTDYIKLQHAHVVQSINYYKNAIQILSQKLKNINDYTFLIFSDDISWCKKQPFFNNLQNIKFVENSDSEEPVEVFQLYLMSMCNHNIIANSSYSWWGAYLNENPDKIVIAPKKWFNPKSKPEGWNTVYCKKWIVCD